MTASRSIRAIGFGKNVEENLALIEGSGVSPPPAIRCWSVPRKGSSAG